MGLTCCGAEKGETHGGVGGWKKRVRGDGCEMTILYTFAGHASVQNVHYGQYLLVRLRSSWVEG